MRGYATNKRASFDYAVCEKYEAGMVLAGHEVKAVRGGRMSLKGSFVIARGNACYLINASIAPYQVKNTPADYRQDRPRKLLLHASEARALIGKSQQRGLTLIPIRVYNKRGKLKLEFGLARRKRKADKRQQIRKRETERTLQRALRTEWG